MIVLQTQVARDRRRQRPWSALAAVVALGAGIIWHQADPQRRRRSAARTVAARRRGGRRRPVGGGGGAGRRPALVLRPGDRRRPAGDRRHHRHPGLLRPGSANVSAPPLTGLLFGLLALAGLVLALAPLLWRIFGQLREERVARIREQERAEVAAVVHDQVLHTLALIQRNAGDTTSVVRLARGQERTLRNWLYKPTGSPTERFAAALEQVAAEVEDTYGDQRGDGRGRRRRARRPGRRAGRGDPRGAGQRGPPRQGGHRLALR